MLWQISTLLVLVAVGAMPMQSQQPTAAERLVGSWVPEQIVRESVTFPAEAFAGMRFTFSQSTLVMTRFPTPKGDECSMTLDVKRSPKHLDCTLKDGTKLAMAWDFAGDQVLLAVPSITAPLDRPAALESKSGSGVLLLTLRRQDR